jgi:hypothetical protein
MASITTPNGTFLEWDDTLKPGDLITTYGSGYAIFERFENRAQTSPLAHYRKAYAHSGLPQKSKTSDYCDASWCKRADEQIQKSVELHLHAIRDLFAMAAAEKIKI